MSGGLRNINIILDVLYHYNKQLGGKEYESKLNSGLPRQAQ